ncbi:MAG TPA: hypothetical protein VLA82_14115, partial [Actinomycetota bacterium]|nr:hypothetical protein [Actinomycetota bacterium]
VGAPQRVSVGVYASDPQGGVNVLVGGDVEVEIAPFEGGDGSPTRGTARYLPAPGTDVPAEPSLSPPAEARGVYELADVTFDAAGVWAATVTFTADGEGPFAVAATPFNVLEEPAYPAPGDRALETENLTLDSDAPVEAIDSGAVTTGEVPDPELHEWTIAEALDEGRPIVALFATPAHCQSLFCGPVTDSVRELAAAYGDKAVFVHVEIWRENPSVLNEAAADWLYRDENLTEPWLFFIDDRGRIVDRWGPLWDTDEVAAHLDELPPMS